MLTRGRVAALLSLLAGVILFGYHARRVFISRRRRRFKESGFARVSPGIKKRGTPLLSSPRLRRHSRHESESSSGAASPECRYESRAAQSLGATSGTDPEDRWKLSSPSALSSLSSLTENTDTDTEIEEARPSKSTPKQKRRFFTKKSKLPTSKRKAQTGVSKTSESESDTFEPGKRNSTWRKLKGGHKAKEDVGQEFTLQSVSTNIQETTKFDEGGNLSSMKQTVKDIKANESSELHKETLPLQSLPDEKGDSDKTLTSDDLSADEHLPHKSAPPTDIASEKSAGKKMKLHTENLTNEESSPALGKFASVGKAFKSTMDKAVELPCPETLAEPSTIEEQNGRRIENLNVSLDAPLKAEIKNDEIFPQSNEECSVTVTIPFPKDTVSEEEKQDVVTVTVPFPKDTLTEEEKQDVAASSVQSGAEEKTKLAESKIKKPSKVLSKVAMFEKAPLSTVDKKKKEDVLPRRNSTKEEILSVGVPSKQPECCQIMDENDSNEAKSEKGAIPRKDSLSSIERLKSKLLNKESKQTGEKKQVERTKVPSKFGSRWKRKNETSVPEDTKGSEIGSKQGTVAKSEEKKSQEDRSKAVEDTSDKRKSLESKEKDDGIVLSNIAKSDEPEYVLKKEKTVFENTSSVPKQKASAGNIGKQTIDMKNDTGEKDVVVREMGSIDDSYSSSVKRDLSHVTGLAKESVKPTNEEKHTDGTEMGEHYAKETFPSANKKPDEIGVEKLAESTVRDRLQKGEKTLDRTTTSVEQHVKTKDRAESCLDKGRERNVEVEEVLDELDNIPKDKRNSKEFAERPLAVNVMDEHHGSGTSSEIIGKKESQKKAEEDIKPKKQVSSSVAQIQSKLANLGAGCTPEKDNEDFTTKKTIEDVQSVNSGVEKQGTESDGAKNLSTEPPVPEKKDELTSKPNAEEPPTENSESSRGSNKVLMKIAMFEKTKPKPASDPNEKFRRKSVASIYPVTETTEDISLVKNRLRFLGDKPTPLKQLSLDDSSLLISSKFGMSQTPELEGKPGNVLKKIKAFQQGIEGGKDSTLINNNSQENNTKQTENTDRKIGKLSIVEKDSSPALGAESGIGSEEDGDNDMYESGYYSPPIKPEGISTSPTQLSSFNKLCKPKEDFSIPSTTGEPFGKCVSQSSTMLHAEKEKTIGKHVESQIEKYHIADPEDKDSPGKTSRQLNLSEPVMHEKDQITLQKTDCIEQSCEEIAEKEAIPQESPNIECTVEAFFSLSDKDKVVESPIIEIKGEPCESPIIKRKISKSNRDSLSESNVPLSEKEDKLTSNETACDISGPEEAISIDATVTLSLAINDPSADVPDNEKSLLSVGDREDQESTYSGLSSVTTLSQNELDIESTPGDDMITSVSQDFNFLQTGEIIGKGGQETETGRSEGKTTVKDLQETSETKGNDALGVCKLKKISKSEPKGRRQSREDIQMQEGLSQEVPHSESEDETPMSALAMKIALCDSKRELELKKKPHEIEGDRAQTSSKLPVFKTVGKRTKSPEGLMTRSAGEVEINQVVGKQSNILRAKTEDRTICDADADSACTLGHGLSKSTGDLVVKSKSSAMPSRIPPPGTKTPPRKKSASPADHVTSRRTQTSAIPKGAFLRSKSEGRQSKKKKSDSDDLIMLMSKSLGDSEATDYFQDRPSRVPVPKFSPSGSKTCVDEIGESKIIKPKDCMPKQYGFNEPEKKSHLPRDDKHSKLLETQKSFTKVTPKSEPTDTHTQDTQNVERQKHERPTKLQPAEVKAKTAGAEESKNDSDVDVGQGCKLPHTMEDSWNTGTMEEFLNAFSDGGYILPKESMAHSLTSHLPQSENSTDRQIAKEDSEDTTGFTKGVEEASLQYSTSRMKAHSKSESSDDAATLDGDENSLERNSELDQDRRKSESSLYDVDSLDGASLGQSANSEGRSDEEDDEDNRFQFGSNEILYEHPQEQAMNDVIYEGYEYEEGETSFIDDTIQEEDDSAETKDLIDWGDITQSSLGVSMNYPNPIEEECETDSLEGEDAGEEEEEEEYDEGDGEHSMEASGISYGAASDLAGYDQACGDDTHMRNLLGPVLDVMQEELGHSGSSEAMSEDEETPKYFQSISRHHESTAQAVPRRRLRAPKGNDWFKWETTGSGSGEQDAWTASPGGQQSPWIPKPTGNGPFGSERREDNRVLFMQDDDDTWGGRMHDQPPHLLPPPGTGRGRRIRPRAIQPDSPRLQPKESHAVTVEKPPSRRQSKEGVPESVLERVPLLCDSNSSMTGSSDSMGLDKEAYDNQSFGDLGQVTSSADACVSDSDGLNESDSLSDGQPAEQQPEELIFKYGLQPDTALDRNVTYRREIKEMFRTLEKGMYRMTGRHAEILVQQLASQDFDFLCKVLVTISNAAAFTKNQDLLREAGCLERLGRLLRGHSMALHVGQSLHYPAVVSSVATTISNLAVNEENQTQLQECIPALIDFAVSEESPESVQLSSLQALTNLSVSPGFHGPYTKLVQTLYELVDSHDETRQMQALKVLVNLSANSDMVPHLLAAKAPTRLLELLSPGTDEAITLRWMNILANVIWTAHDRGITYAGLPTEYKAPSPETLYTSLYGHSNSVQLRSKVFLLSKSKNPDIRYHAARIYSCLV